MAHRIFVSYAHVDDQPETDATDGWVTHLVRELNRRVTGILGRQGLVRFTIDHQLNGHERLDEQIRRLILDSSIFLMVGSPGYLLSDWCLNRELPEFLNKDVCQDRIFVVEKMEYDRARMPGAISGRIGKLFWEKDDIKGEWRTFGDPVANALADRNYNVAVNRLSQEIADVIARGAEIQPLATWPATTSPIVEGPAVYLAEPSGDLEAPWESVRQSLLQQKIQVITSERFPADPSLYRDALKEVLKREGIVFVQLLSEALGRKLIADDENSRVVRLQFEVAQKQCVPICQWRSVSVNLYPSLASEDLTASSSIPASRLAHYALLSAETVKAFGLEEFKDMVYSRAKAPPPQVVVARDPRTDDTFARYVLNTVRGLSLTAELAATNDAPDQLDSKLKECDAVLFVQGLVPVQQLQEHFADCATLLVRRMKAMPKRAFILAPPPPKTAIPTRSPTDQINCVDGFDPERIALYLDTLPRPEA
jgi:hypothetical protein